MLSYVKSCFRCYKPQQPLSDQGVGRKEEYQAINNDPKDAPEYFSHQRLLPERESKYFQEKNAIPAHHDIDKVLLALKSAPTAISKTILEFNQGTIKFNNKDDINKLLNDMVTEGWSKYISGLDFSEAPHVTDDDLGLLRDNFPNLKILNLSNCKNISERGIEIVCQHELKELYLSHTKIDGEALCNFYGSESERSLERLSLVGCTGISDIRFELGIALTIMVQDCYELTYLNISCSNTLIDTLFWHSLSGPHMKLNELNATNCIIDSELMARLATGRNAPSFKSIDKFDKLDFTGCIAKDEIDTQALHESIIQLQKIYPNIIKYS